MQEEPNKNTENTNISIRNIPKSPLEKLLLIGNRLSIAFFLSFLLGIYNNVDPVSLQIAPILRLFDILLLLFSLAIIGISLRAINAPEDTDGYTYDRMLTLAKPDLIASAITSFLIVWALAAASISDHSNLTIVFIAYVCELSGLSILLSSNIRYWTVSYQQISDQSITDLDVFSKHTRKLVVRGFVALYFALYNLLFVFSVIKNPVGGIGIIFVLPCIIVPGIVFTIAGFVRLIRAALYYSKHPLAKPTAPALHVCYIIGVLMVLSATATFILGALLFHINIS